MSEENELPRRSARLKTSMGPRPIQNLGVGECRRESERNIMQKSFDDRLLDQKSEADDSDYERKTEGLRRPRKRKSSKKEEPQSRRVENLARKKRVGLLKEGDEANRLFELSRPQSSPKKAVKLIKENEGDGQRDEFDDFDGEPVLPELEAPRIWTEILAQQPGTSAINTYIDDTETDDDSEEDKWHDIKEEKIQYSAVEVTLKKDDLERKEEKMLRTEAEKVLREIQDDISKLTFVSMIGHGRCQMKAICSACSDREWHPEWAKKLEDKVKYGRLEDDILKEFNQNLTNLNDDVNTVQLPVRYKVLYDGKNYFSQLDLCSVLGLFLMRCGLDVRLAMAFDVPGVQQPKQIKKDKGSSYKGPYYFLEYWCDSEHKYVSISPETMQIGGLNEQEKMWNYGCHYVLSVNRDLKVKDVSGLYCGDYLKLMFRKERHSEDFIQEFMSLPDLKPNSPKDLEEDEQIRKYLISQPMPKSLNEFKNHPFYVLEKDLLKFEAIYPREIQSLGEVRGHKIFPRDAVHILQGELNWIRIARSVKNGEKPYKVVKARPKLSIPVDERVPLFLNTFGYWQTEPYVPPKVINGKIPRNEYGNVYMYQPDMVPDGCVHLKLNGIQNIGRQLGVDAVPAVVGWEFSGGRNHPLLEGCVVLKEDEESLRDAWTEWNAIRKQRSIQRTVDKAVTLWKRFIRGKILLEKMKKKYKIQ